MQTQTGRLRRQLPLVSSFAIAAGVAGVVVVLQALVYGRAPVATEYAGPLVAAAGIGVILGVRSMKCERSSEQLAVTVGLLRQANGLVERSEESLRTILGSMSDGVAVVDGECTVIWANRTAAELAGLDIESIKGQDCCSVWKCGAGSCANCPMREAVVSGLRSTELLTINGFGSYRVVATPVPKRKAQERSAVIVFTDMNNARQAEEALRQSIVDKDVLLREAHHRAKNYLQLAASLASLTTGSSAEDYAARLEQRILTMAMVHEQLYFRNHSGATTLQEFLDPLARSVLESVASPRTELEISTSLPDRELDSRRAVSIGLILNELITNSVKHGYPGRDRGHIDIAASVDDTWIELVYADDGVGMSAEGRHTLESGAGSETGRGAGLIREIIKQLRGTIAVDTGSDDRGLVTRIKLPAERGSA